MDVEYSIVKDGSKFCLSTSYNGQEHEEIEIDARAVKIEEENYSLKNNNFVYDENGDGIYRTISAVLLPSVIEKLSIWEAFWNFIKSIFVGGIKYTDKDKRKIKKIHIMPDEMIFIMVDK